MSVAFIKRYRSTSRLRKQHSDQRIRLLILRFALFSAGVVTLTELTFNAIATKEATEATVSVKFVGPVQNLACLPVKSMYFLHNNQLDVHTCMHTYIYIQRHTYIHAGIHTYEQAHPHYPIDHRQWANYINR